MLTTGKLQLLSVTPLVKREVLIKVPVVSKLPAMRVNLFLKFSLAEAGLILRGQDTTIRQALLKSYHYSIGDQKLLLAVVLRWRTSCPLVELVDVIG